MKRRAVICEICKRRRLPLMVDGHVCRECMMRADMGAGAKRSIEVWVTRDRETKEYYDVWLTQPAYDECIWSGHDGEYGVELCLQTPQTRRLFGNLKGGPRSIKKVRITVETIK